MTGGWLNALLLEANKRRSTTAVDPQHLKVKTIQYQSNRKLLHHYQHSKNQLNS